MLINRQWWRWPRARIMHSMSIRQRTSPDARIREAACTRFENYSHERGQGLDGWLPKLPWSGKR